MRLQTVVRLAIAVQLVLLAACDATRPPSASVGPTLGSPAASPSAVASTTPSDPSAPTVPPSGAAFDPEAVKVVLEPFVDGILHPLAIVNAGDGSGRLFVVEQGGRVRIVKDGKVALEPFLDIGDEVSSGGERGLLGLAFHPRFPDDPRIFVDYTDRSGDTQISSFAVDPATPDRVDPDTEKQILSVEQPFPNHNGGAVVFDPAGKLLISMGDGGSGGDPQGNGQSLDTLLAKILRIDIDATDGDRAYTIPADNPYASGSDGHRPEIWLTGLRNPWRISVDRATGDVWIGDVGKGDWEEIDVQRAGAPGGTNFGWNRMEGSHCFEPSQDCATPELTLPVAEYGHDAGCTVIGGVVDRSEDVTPLSGGYLFGDYCSGRLWVIDPASDGTRDPTVVGDAGGSLSAFGEDESGAIYAADISGGRVLRVVATAP